MEIHEIYQSIQGESSYAGLPCVFVRTTGCNLRCRWCDTAHAFEEGEQMSVDAVLEKVRSFACRWVEITGGEPLLQEESFRLISALLDENFLVLLETSGAISIQAVDQRVVVILDLKCPGSGMADRINWENLKWLKKKDEVKFVIADRADFDWAKKVLADYRALDDKIIHFSPVFGEMAPQELASWILEEKLAVRLQMQLHKYIWDPCKRGV